MTTIDIHQDDTGTYRLLTTPQHPKSRNEFSKGITAPASKPTILDYDQMCLDCLKDYRNDSIHDGEINRGLPLTPYQQWVLAQILDYAKAVKNPKARRVSTEKHIVTNRKNLAKERYESTKILA